MSIKIPEKPKWQWVLDNVSKLSLAQVHELLRMEWDNGRRHAMLLRIHKRLCQLRMEQERRSLLELNRWPPSIAQI